MTEQNTIAIGQDPLGRQPPQAGSTLAPLW
jgi:hypothetical protein